MALLVLKQPDLIDLVIQYDSYYYETIANIWANLNEFYFNFMWTFSRFYQFMSPLKFSWNSLSEKWAKSWELRCYEIIHKFLTLNYFYKKFHLWELFNQSKQIDFHVTNKILIAEVIGINLVYTVKTIPSTITAIIFKHYRVVANMALEVLEYTMCRFTNCDSWWAYYLKYLNWYMLSWRGDGRFFLVYGKSTLGTLTILYSQLGQETLVTLSYLNFLMSVTYLGYFSMFPTSVTNLKAFISMYLYKVIRSEMFYTVKKCY